MREPPSGRRCANPSACRRWCSPPAIWDSALSPTAAQFPLWAALLSTLTIFALPGQLAMLEMSIAGSAPVMIVITVSLTAARFLPMTVALLPMLRSPGRPDVADLRRGASAGDDRMGGQHAPLPRVAARAAPALVRRVRADQLGGLPRGHRGRLPAGRIAAAAGAAGTGVRRAAVFRAHPHGRDAHSPRRAGARLRRGGGSADLPRGAAMERAAGRADRRHRGLGACMRAK